MKIFLFISLRNIQYYKILGAARKIRKFVRRKKIRQQLNSVINDTLQEVLVKIYQLLLFLLQMC